MNGNILRHSTCRSRRRGADGRLLLACSMQHGQTITMAPKTLLKKEGFAVRYPAEGHLCCVSAGTYNILQPVISAKEKAQKVKNIGKRQADPVWRKG